MQGLIFSNFLSVFFADQSFGLFKKNWIIIRFFKRKLIIDDSLPNNSKKKILFSILNSEESFEAKDIGSPKPMTESAKPTTTSSDVAFSTKRQAEGNLVFDWFFYFWHFLLILTIFFHSTVNTFQFFFFFPSIIIVKERKTWILQKLFLTWKLPA